MIGIITELIISWLLLRITENKSILALGIRPDGTRVQQLITGMLLAAIICTVYYLLSAIVVHSAWSRNGAFTLTSWSKSTWWVLKSVLFEELIFRGALLYIAVSRLGINRACVLSAIAFGIYHWFSYGAFGNPAAMIFIFLTTAIAGWMYARAFAVTGSLYLPVGLHFGWNFFTIVIFSSGPLGHQLLMPGNSNKATGIVSLLLFLFQVFALPVAAHFYIRRINRRRHIFAYRNT